MTIVSPSLLVHASSQAPVHGSYRRRLEEGLRVPPVAFHDHPRCGVRGRGPNIVAGIDARRQRRRRDCRHGRARCACRSEDRYPDAVEVPSGRLPPGFLPAPNCGSRARAEQAVRETGVETLVPQSLLDQASRRSIETQRLFERPRILST